MKTAKAITPHSSRGELLVALLPEKRDLAILQEQGWYRIPVDSTPKRWPPRWLAFYQGKPFGDDKYRIQYVVHPDHLAKI